MDSVYQAAFKSAFDQDSLTPTNLFDQSVATNTFHQATSTSEMDQAAPTSELGLASSTSDQIAYLSKNYPLMFFDQTASESFDDHVMPEISTGQVESTNLDPQTTDSRLIFDASSTEPQPTFHDIFQSKRGASIYVPPIFPNLKPQATSTNLIYQSASTRVLLKVKSTNVKDHAASTSGMHPNASTSKDMVCNEPFHDDIKKDSTDGVIGVEVSHESSSNESHLDGERNSTPNLIERLEYVLRTSFLQSVGDDYFQFRSRNCPFTGVIDGDFLQLFYSLDSEEQDDSEFSIRNHFCSDNFHT
ncbi:hypothetical protein TNIN_71161 [Trichonephila inaurata madagascariensis]|uniref:Uncharacterized protein n=1 Tax=Trichonephila inaurata madagascariensis TaxID=2747483 RepID=A0A8X6Y1N6_9ARAC|nr:hypothetical protein TNIN_71161 [Trichonephila inaurata madagascariensis]